MKITVVGPGAMGCLFAALLARTISKPDLWLLDKDARRARKIDEKGVTVIGLHRIKRKVGATADARKIGYCDLVIIFTKSYDTARALDEIGPLLARHTNVLSLQNGLGNLELISGMVGQERALGGATAHGSTLLDIGKVRHAGRGETVIGKPGGEISGDLRRITKIFNESGIPTRMSKDINRVIWGKLIINAGINAPASITGLPNGALLEDEETGKIVRRAAAEAARVARRKKIKLNYDDPARKVESVCRATAANICSMLQDIVQGKRTEIDYINGAVVRAGKALGMETPVNEMLVSLVKTMEARGGADF